MNYYAASGVDSAFGKNVSDTIQRLQAFSPKTRAAISKIDNVIILKNSNSQMPDGFEKTKDKLEKYALDAYGFVSKPDRAIVLNQENHYRKDTSLEGSYQEQAADTASHELGHLVDDEYSTSDKFKSAYFMDLKNIEKMLKEGEKEIQGHNLDEMLEYLKHYIEGADFSDGIDENDITREGLRENFAECFSTIMDANPSEINSVYAALFPNTMRETLNFVI